MSLVDELMDGISPGVGMRIKLSRWFRSGPGQHSRSQIKSKSSDLVRMHGGPMGLPTIRADLANDCDKISLKMLNGPSVDLIDNVISKLSRSQLVHLGRLA